MIRRRFFPGCLLKAKNKTKQNKQTNKKRTNKTLHWRDLTSTGEHHAHLPILATWSDLQR